VIIGTYVPRKLVKHVDRWSMEVKDTMPGYVSLGRQSKSHTLKA